MADSDLERVFAVLEESGARYLVVGGVAVVLHGHPRLTADLDLVIALDPQNLGRAFRALSGLGYSPRAPIGLEQFADPELRRSFIEDKGMTVLALWSQALPATEVDVFASEPFPFDDAYRRALRAVVGATTVTVASIPDLIELKRSAVGRRIWRTCAPSRRSSGSCRGKGMAESSAESGFERHRREQRRAWLRLSYRERLEWLEQAKRFAARALEAARARQESRSRTKA